MCGIVGYSGAKLSIEPILDGLKSLEYRGYDSAGIAVCSDGQLSITKQVGGIDALESKINLENGPVKTAHLGIGHTRWATHGAPTSQNAHPHHNTDKTIATRSQNGTTMNSITIIGTLTDNPARRDTKRGVVATFRLAASGTPRIWIDIESWGQLAGRVAQYLVKGRSVAVVGNLAHDSWTDQAGHRRDRWYIRAERITFLDAPPNGDGGPGQAGRPDSVTRHDAGTRDSNPEMVSLRAESTPSPEMVIVQ